ncbi:Sorting nexin MVP1 [Phytophthora citrophthora]|uniref:Sorting nexin MVP1 n=1 Tax=Phytophthora citrophthora TaxID=4793 RepID=A0AAD9LLW7_9STRA|nr:Sorting nexin MVP1 [Phytophthora citrophthora]
MSCLSDFSANRIRSIRPGRISAASMHSGRLVAPITKSPSADSTPSISLSISPICGMELLVSYIKNGGNLKKMDKSCVKKMPPLNMTITMEYLYGYLVTDDAYDGVYDESLYNQLAGSSARHQTTKMRFLRVILLAGITVSPVTAQSNKTAIQWKSCPQFTVTSQTPIGSGSGSASADAECVTYNAPLCYPGLCETPEGADSTIEVFVKRYPATVGNPKTARNVWLLEGGPGISTVPMESTAVDLQTKLGGSFNMYLMDHRGTGRSTRLSCSAATKLNSSLWGSDVEAPSVGKCAEELISKYGDMASFSTTSAAKDVATFMGEHTNGEDTIVFGWSYGTMLGERLIHLDPPEVTGYVLDGVYTSMGARTSEFQYNTNADTDFGEVADRFLAMCQKNKKIATRFKKKGLAGTIKHLITQFDKDPESPCAVITSTLFNSTDSTGSTSNATEVQPASFALRFALGAMMSDSKMRKLIPPVVYRLNRCADKDLDILNRVIQVVQESMTTKVEDETYQSLLLLSVITYSEMWEMPSPSVETLKKRFTDVLMSDAGVYSSTELYCAYSKEKSRTCNQFQTGKYDADPIIYDRDEYWNKSAVIPTQASVLILSGMLDGRTMHKYAEFLLDALQGDNKELIAFEHATHGTIMSTPLIPSDPESPHCGMEVLVSYIKNGGNLKKMDKSCVKKMPPFNMTITTEYLYGYLVTDDAYDGVYNESLYYQAGAPPAQARPPAALPDPKRQRRDDSTATQKPLNRKRFLRFLKSHELKFGLAPVARDESSGEVTLVVCRFCQHFGREQRPDKQRRSTKNIKYFRNSFRTDQYQQHHELSHCETWKRYLSCTDDEKRVFFPLPEVAPSETPLTGQSTQKLKVELAPGEVWAVEPTLEEKQRCFEIAPAIVELVAILAIGTTEPTVEKVVEKQSHHLIDHAHEQNSNSNAVAMWNPPKDTFEACTLVGTVVDPLHRVVVHSRAQIDCLVELAAAGMSFRQISIAMQTFRNHASVLLRDILQGAHKASPQYTEDQTAEYIRLIIAVNLSVVSRLLRGCWAFSLELRASMEHSPVRSYLEFRVKAYGAGAMHNIHLISIPAYENKCKMMMFTTLERVLAVVLPNWRQRLIGVATDGQTQMPNRMLDIVAHLQQETTIPVVYRSSSGCHQLDCIVVNFYSSLQGGCFLLALKELSTYIRRQPDLVARMTPPPPRPTSSTSCKEKWLAFGKETNWIAAHRELICRHLEIEKPPSAPDISWWLFFAAVNWVATCANNSFEKLLRNHASIADQCTAIAGFSNDCAVAFHALGPLNDSLLPVDPANSKMYKSRKGRFALSKASMVEFIKENDPASLPIINSIEAPFVDLVGENLAICGVNMIESLLELSTALGKEQNLKCAVSSNSQTAIVTDIPPVLPHELASLNPDEFAVILEKHRRVSLKHADIKAIREEHELLRITFADNKDLQPALELCKQRSSFNVAWSLMDARFKSLEAFAGGLATVYPSFAEPLSDRNARDLVLCTKDLEEARLLLADFEVESALHAQQFQALTKLQEEIYDREINDRRTRKRQKMNKLFNISSSRVTMQFFATSKDSLVAAALEASMRSVKLCGTTTNTFDLEEHQHWCTGAVKDPVVVNVSAPEARGAYLQKHTTYLVSHTRVVTQESHQEGVRRRFRDFEWLRVVLHARYVGLLVPSLPEKTTTAAVLKTDAFMQSRMRGLQRFLNDIMKSPYLRSDAAVVSFLGEPGDEATWEAMRKNTAVMDNAGEGHMRWLQRILCEHIASSPENEISVFKRHVEQRERLLSELAACAKRLADKSAAMSKDVSTLHAIFAGWQLAETGTGSFEARNDAPLVALLDKSTVTFSGWSQVESYQSAIYELLLLEHLKYMLCQATAMKQMLIERERAVASEALPECKPSPPPPEFPASPPTSGFSVASFTSAASTAASKFMSAVEPPSLSIEEQRRRAHHTSELITRALMAEEMQRFRVQTTKELENIMNHLSCAEAQLSKRSGSVWREYLKTSSVDPQELARSTKELLDSASTGPTPAAADAF